MSTTFPGESDEYRSARDRLLAREVELRQAMEAVAEERRALPRGGAVPDDYMFRSADGGPSIEVRLSELFAPGRDSLIVYNMMFPRDPGDDRPGPAEGRTAQLALADSPCPSCTIEPLWNLFDLIPERRGIDWDEQLDYSGSADGLPA